MQRRGYLAYGVRRDIAPLLVCVPHWTRLNIYAERPGDRPHKPVTEAVIAYSYFLRLRAR